QIKSQPRKAIASLRRSFRQLARGFRQRTVRIVDTSLRNRAKSHPLHRLAVHGERRDPCEDFGAQQSSNPEIRNDQTESTVGAVENRVSEGNAFLFVGTEIRGVGALSDNQRNFPREVVSVLQTGVHSLRADGAVPVGGVSSRKQRRSRKRTARRW